MSYLAQVSHGAIAAGQRMIVAGPEGIGKTTLACGAPAALLAPMESGSGSISVARLPPLDKWEAVEAVCLELIAASQAGRIARGSSIIWDSLTALERMIHDFTIRSDPGYKPNNAGKLTMATAHGAYGKAYDVALETFGRFTRYLDALAIHGGINCICTCHVFASTVVDPAHGEYRSWDLLLHSPKNEKTYGIREFATQWADFIGFLHEPIFVMKAEEGAKMAKAVSGGQGRVIAVDRQPGWVAKNRYQLGGLVAIPDPAKSGGLGQTWNHLAAAIYEGSGKTIDLYNRSI